ncbi:MAG: aminotransferase class III-fold pyridoxal phosphate-dependent enzyme, partial [Actinobacteria bacterium]|nr:aminotransferase class III-fold pyridoxal phosphate-dependent enzyme [Actinomycetota bacterium]
MSHVFHRSPDPIIAVRAEGCWIHGIDGATYLDAAGGAVVSNIGHGDEGVLSAMTRHMATLDYLHPSVFTSVALEDYAAALAPRLPMDDPRVFPTTGGSEAVETALKMTRAYHLARGEEERVVIVSREMSYHGNTLWALDVSGREPLRRPYEPWLGRSVKVPAVTEYRCPSSTHPDGCAQWHVDRLDETLQRVGPGRVAAFVAEPIGGATLGAATPPEGYWPAIAELCRRHGVLLVVDEVMTGFGRTGRWFGIDHYGVRPDILATAKGAAGGYWPLGLAVASGEVHGTLAGGFIHGFTFSHFPAGAAAAHAVLDRLVAAGL